MFFLSKLIKRVIINVVYPSLKMWVKVVSVNMKIGNLKVSFVKVNQRVINIFYPSLKMRVKMTSVNIKIGTLKVVFLTISTN